LKEQEGGEKDAESIVIGHG